MILIKKWLTMFAVMTALLLLTACGNENAATDPRIFDDPRSHTAEDFMPISKGFTKYPIWIQTDENPVRDSKVSNILVFKKDKVTVYNLDKESGFNKGNNTEVLIEDILDMSDDELIKFAIKTSTNVYDEYEKSIENQKALSVDWFNSQIDNLLSGEGYEDDYVNAFKTYLKEFKPMTNDISYKIEGERSPLSSKYSLDIKIDELGQHTQNIDLIIPNGNLILDTSSISGSSTFNNYIHHLYFSFYLSLTESVYFDKERERYIEDLKTYGHFEKKDGFDPAHPQNFVFNPLVWTTEDETISLNPGVIRQKIFDTTFAGINTGSSSLVTRVKDSFIGFRLDDPSTKSKNVTIEGK